MDFEEVVQLWSKLNYCRVDCGKVAAHNIAKNDDKSMFVLTTGSEDSEICVSVSQRDYASWPKYSDHSADEVGIIVLKLDEGDISLPDMTMSWVDCVS